MGSGYGLQALQNTAAGMAGELRKTEHRFVSCVGVDQPGWIDNSIAPMHHSIKRNEFTSTINGIE